MDRMKNQESLVDQSATGRVNPWKEKKMANQLLSAAYEEVAPHKAERLRDCSMFLIFRILGDGRKKLKTMNACRVRLCPLCAWRRSLKIFGHTKKIMDGMKSEKEYGYIFLTLTIRNCNGEDLNDRLNDMMKAWDRFARYKRVKQAVKGWYRGLEITHNTNPLSSSFDTYHPHFHCIFAVDKKYFKDSRYIKHEEWTSFWEKAMRLEYTPVVNVKRVKGDTARAVAETAKYAVKDSDYIIPDDWDLTVDTVRLLDSVLDKRRFIAYGGKFKEWHKKLNLDDEMDGDLINVELDQQEVAETEQLITYVWHTGYSQYYRGEL